MNTNPIGSKPGDSNASSSPETGSSSASPDFKQSPFHRWRRRFLALLAILVVGVIGYSVYVAVHEPDPQETLVLGQTRWAAGGPAGLRLLVRNRKSGQPIANAEVSLQLLGPGGKRRLGTFRTAQDGRLKDSLTLPNFIPDAEVSLQLLGPGGKRRLGTFRTAQDGCLKDSLTVPNLFPGPYQLQIDVQSRIGRDSLILPVEIHQVRQLFLTSDKPIYQPGQTIHLRAMAAEGPALKPMAAEPLTFEIADAKGNKVFKETRATSRFGIASADFVLAQEVNAGRYHLSLIAGSTTNGRTVEVKSYVLPKFRIKLSADKAFYLPGQIVSGRLQANYFFGKPVSGAAVNITAGTWQEKPVEIATIDGKTDTQGSLAFQLPLPAHFVGLPLHNGNAVLELTASVTDTAGHAEHATHSLTVAASDLDVAVIPESPSMAPGLENWFYILTSYPDGQPARCRVSVNGRDYRSDAQGVCVAPVLVQGTNVQLQVTAWDDFNKSAVIAFNQPVVAPVAVLALRTDRAVYRVGDPMQLTVVSGNDSGVVFVDVIRNRQTVLTRSLPLAKGRGNLTVPLPADLAGPLKINAYTITESGEDRGCSRLVYVNAATGLQIQAKSDRAEYRPGDTARVQFQVADIQGRPTPAALGVCAVDESVFWLAENQPGLQSQFMAAEGELLRPRYQIKQFDSPARLLASGEANQTLAQAFFASLQKAESAGTSLEDLVKQGLVSPRLLANLRTHRSSPEFERIRRNPNYAAVLRLLDRQETDYNLRDATGPAKQSAADQYREQYFALLVGLGIVLFLVLLVSGFFFVRYAGAYGRIATLVDENLALRNSDRFALKIAARFYYVFSGLVILQLLLYPFGGVLLEMASHRHNVGRTLLAVEALLVLAAALWQGLGILQLRIHALNREARSLLFFLLAYVGQMVVTRTILAGGFASDESAVVWVLWTLLAAFLTPLIILSATWTWLKGLFQDRNVPLATETISVGAIAFGIFLCMILAGMLLPALANSKAKAQRIVLQNDLKQVELAMRIHREDNSPASAAATSENAPPRIRRDFPETLFWQPQLITDDQGHASVEIPLADSITTWRTTVDAIGISGRMGNAEIPLRVFQDFFVDMDLPVSVSLDDQISVPVVCYNYLATAQTLQLKLTAADWFDLPGGLTAQTVSLAPNEVKSAYFPIRARRVGSHRLLVAAQGSQASDAVEREVRVLPVGRLMERTENGVLKDAVQFQFTVPPDAIPASAHGVVKLYPSRFSEIVEGLDSIFRAPYGCFEQTSSVTYPNVLALDYLRRTGQLTPEIEIKARKYINAGYQRLLTFEVAGGGFEWFGRPPANICLTAYGILEFADMAKVHPVDEQVIERAIRWLRSQQNSDGSWNEINRGWTWAGRGSITAFAAWCLAESGRDSAALDRALDYLRAHPEELGSDYARALAANAFLARQARDSFGLKLAADLQQRAQRDSMSRVYWDAPGYGVTYSRGESLAVETTGLAALALMKAGQWPQTVKEALLWISAQKDPQGTWQTTQATILAMRALLQGSSAPLGQDFTSRITIILNGRTLDTVKMDKEQGDVMRLISLTPHLQAGDNRLEIRQQPAGELPYQWAGGYWLPASQHPGKTPGAPDRTSNAEPLQISMDYDRATLAVNDELQCRVAVRNRTGQVINMAIVDLGIPPGFTVDATRFETMRIEGRVAKFDLTGKQVILYLRELPTENPVEFAYTLRASYPLRVTAPAAKVYEYYNPTNRGESRGAIIEVH